MYSSLLPHVASATIVSITVAWFSPALLHPAVALPLPGQGSVELVDGGNLSIKLGRNAQNISGNIRIMERGEDGTLSTVETFQASDPLRVKLLESGRELVLTPSQTIPPGSTWVVDLAGVCSCRLYRPAPPVRGLWKSSDGVIPVLKSKIKSPEISQACACDALDPITPLAFFSPAAPASAAAVAQGSNLGWIILGAGAIVGTVLGIAAISNGGSGSGGGGGGNRPLVTSR